jgi:hypothetical protein
MPAPLFRVEFVPSFRNLRGKFAKADKDMFEARRDAVRQLGRKWVELARDEAPKSPTSTGTFWKGIGFRTFVTGETIGFQGYSPQPLGRFITEGTKRHRIVARNARALFFFWPKVGAMTVVPRGGGPHGKIGDKFYVGKGYVDHPGTKPNPFTIRAYKRWEPQVISELRKVALRWVVTASGS